jgi:putative transposase
VRNRKLVQRVYREERLAVTKRAKEEDRGISSCCAETARASKRSVGNGLHSRRSVLWSCLLWIHTGRMSSQERGSAIEVDHSLPGSRVTETPDRVASERGFLEGIICDNGPEFVSQDVDFSAYRHGVALHFIQPGKPVRTLTSRAFTESFATSA